MFDVGDSLRDAFEAARARLGGAQSSVARANAGEDAGRKAGAALAAVAETEIFTEALLAAQRARLQEIKAVAK